jgi:hypothetical protein
MFTRRCEAAPAQERKSKEEAANTGLHLYRMKVLFKIQYHGVRLMKSILLVTLFLCVAVSAFGQSLPIKEGLWETTVSDDDGTPSMRLIKCITQKSYVEMLTKANTHPGCKVATQDITSHGMTLDVSCSRPNVQTSAHQVVELVDSEHTRSTTTMKMAYKGKSSDSTTRSSSHFVKSDCGNVKPGDPPIITEQK